VKIPEDQRACLDCEGHVFTPFAAHDGPELTRYGCMNCALIVDPCPSCEDGYGPQYYERGEVITPFCGACAGYGFVLALDAGPVAASSAHGPTTTE
jgi:hypothetical protein